MDLVLYGVLMLGLILFMFLPQWTARRRQQKKLAELTVGDRVITIGGFIGTLTHFDPEANAARIRLAEGVEVEILPGAISRRYEAPAEPVETTEDAL